MRKLYEREGKISRFELILIIAIVIMSLFFVLLGLRWQKSNLDHGNDSMAVNTCESVARINSNNGTDCVVNDCPGRNGGQCTHQVRDGHLGYFDHWTNTIVGEKPDGYNEANVMKIGDQTFYGDEDTMVIQVIAHTDGRMELSWVPGRNAE